MATSACSAIIENVFRRNGSLKRLRAELSVYYWPRVAGVEIAKNVAAVRYFNGYLYLKTENPTLAHQLTMMNPDIIKRYRMLLGSDIIKGIKIKIGSIIPEQAVAKAAKITQLAKEEQQFIVENCQTIKDQEVAECFKRLMEKSFEVKHRMKDKGGGSCLSCNVLIEPNQSYCPVCEIKLKEEMSSYINYLKKNNQEINLNELPLAINAANEQLIRKMLNF